MAITSAELIARLAAAIVLGGAIGYERELREHPAGLRTHLLVALASATFTIASLQIVYFQHYVNDGIVRIDVGRIASNIVVGIGFLGGGAIVHAGMTIKGLTTAASLWLVAAIGLASGGGMLVLAASVTLSSLLALVVLRYAIEEPRRRIVRMRVQLDLEGDFISRAALVELLAPLGADVVKALDYSRNLTTNRSRIYLTVKLPREDLEEAMMKRLSGLSGLRRVKVERPID
jgi:putative Mg2+ transporter-C (MgtC) family protein